MTLIATLVYYAFEAYIILIIAMVAMHWLIQFDIINAKNAQAKRLIILMHRATEPVFKPVSRFIPRIGGFDLTPVVVIIGLSFLRSILMSMLMAV